MLASWYHEQLYRFVTSSHVANSALDPAIAIAERTELCALPNGRVEQQHHPFKCWIWPPPSRPCSMSLLTAWANQEPLGGGMMHFDCRQPRLVQQPCCLHVCKVRNPGECCQHWLLCAGVPVQ